MSIVRASEFQEWPEFQALVKRLGLQKDMANRPITKITIDWTDDIVYVDERIIVQVEDTPD